MAAMDTPSVSSGSTSASVARTATITPPDGRACIRRPRAATSFAASARDSTPATCAAAISPIECPTRKSGVTPHDSTRRNNATSTANSAGLRVDGLIQVARPRRSPRATDGRVTVQLRAGLVERLREHRERRRQPQAHARPLRPLTGEHERRLARAPPTRRPDPTHQRPAPPAPPARTPPRRLRVCRAVRGQGEPDIHRVGLHRHEPGGLAAQRLRGARRDHPRHHPGGRGPLPRR